MQKIKKGGDQIARNSEIPDRPESICEDFGIKTATMDFPAVTNVNLDIREYKNN